MTSAKMARTERAKSVSDAAVRLFSERGYDATTMDDIAAAAGVTKPILYRHFDSKQELFSAVVWRTRDELIGATLRAGGSESSDVGARLRAMLDAWLAQIDRDRAAARLVFMPLSGDEEVRRVQDELSRRQRATQAALLREFVPALGADDADLLGDLMWGVLLGGALWLLDDAARSRDALAPALLSVAENIVSQARKLGEAHA